MIRIIKGTNEFLIGSQRDRAALLQPLKGAWIATHGVANGGKGQSLINGKLGCSAEQSVCHIFHGNKNNVKKHRVNAFFYYRQQPFFC